MRNLLIFSLLIFLSTGFAQNSDTLSAVEKSAKLIELGIELYDNNDYEGALNLFDTVAISDPNYGWAVYEKALCYWQMDNLDSALVYSREALSLRPDDVDIVIGAGSIFDDAGLSEEAIKLLETSLNKWPYNANLMYNLGLCYIRNNRLQDAENVILKGIIIRPFHANSHLALARLNFKMGRLARSYIAYNMSALMQPIIKTLSEYENCIDGSRDSLNYEYLYQYPSDGNNYQKWEQLDYLMKTGLAFNQEYVYNADFDFLSARQSHLLFKQMNYDKEDKCLYNQFYVRFFKELINNGRYNTYLYYSLKELSNDKVTSWISKNQNELNSFVSWAQSYFNEKRSYKYCPSNEALGLRMLHFDENNNFLGEGLMEEKKNLIKSGSWIHTRSNGSITEKGAYINDIITGEWLIYGPNGLPRQKLQFKDGELDGDCFSYDPKGNVTGMHPRKKGISDGYERFFTSAGLLLSEYNTIDGKIEGTATEYSYPGFFVKTTSYVNNKAEGPFTEKWLTGDIKTEGFYKDSLIEGSLTTWYPHSVKESTGIYTKDVLTGSLTKYHPNGVKSEEQTHDEEGLISGIKYYYNHEGGISQKDSLYSKGVLNGFKYMYYADGRISSIQEIKNDSIVGVKSYDSSGNLIYQAVEDEKKSLYFKTHFNDGLVESEGKLQNGLYEGEWKNYFTNGNLKSVYKFEKGKQNGKQYLYYSNGELKEEFNCKEGILNGMAVIYYSNGIIQKTGNLLNGEHDGEIIYYYANGKLQSKSFFDKGVQAGRIIQYNPKGDIKQEEFFSNEGKSYRKKLYNHLGNVSLDIEYEFDTIRYSELYPSGKIKHKGAIFDNSRHGIFEWFYPNGQLERKEHYIYGVLNGTVTNWEFNGNISSEVPYIMNNIHGNIKWYNIGKVNASDPYEMNTNQGLYLSFHSNGRLQRKIPFVNDLREGEYYHYSPDSMLMHKLLYSQDLIKEVTFLNPQGNYVKPIIISKGKQDIVTNYANGKVSTKFTLENGLFAGKLIIYYPSGKIFSETDFIKGDINGSRKSYFPNGNLKESSEFNNDKRDGSYLLRHENGHKAKEGNFIMNYEDGEWLIYNESGKLTHKLFYDCGELYEIINL